MPAAKNPFRPGFGHEPPYLAGREEERRQFARLLEQDVILENLLLTGLRGIGKTVLLETMKPLAAEHGWLWAGADFGEAASASEDAFAKRICTDLATLTSHIRVETQRRPGLGFGAPEKVQTGVLNYETLAALYAQTPGLAADKLKNVLQVVWKAVANESPETRGIIFAYDEAQILRDHAEEKQYPRALLLDVFQNLQRRGLPLMLALSGLPNLLPNLVDSRTYAERMFRVLVLQKLDEGASRDAVLKPVQNANLPPLPPESVDEIIRMSGGYPYFIQFICKEAYDAFAQGVGNNGHRLPAAAIERKLDADFFAGRWARANARQRELMLAIASLENGGAEFTAHEIAGRSKTPPGETFTSGQAEQILEALMAQGLVFQNRCGRYSFAIPLFGKFILRQMKGGT